MVTKFKIHPKSTGVMTFKVTTQNGTATVPATDATIVAAVYRPDGTVAAQALAVTNAGSGLYTLAVDPAWSTLADGSALEGKFVVELTITRNGAQLVERFPFSVSF